MLLLITLAGGFWATTTEIKRRADLRSDQLLAAFRAEVETIKPLVCSAAATHYDHWKKSEHKFLPTVWNLPHPIFQANVANLGELNDVKTTEQLAKFYVTLQAALDAARRVQDEPPGSIKQFSFVNYLRETSNACSTAILLTAKFNDMLAESISLDKFMEQAKIQGEDLRYRELMNQIREDIGKVQFRISLPSDKQSQEK
ncbi:hypothetical protein MYX84_11480 [Acidobacteria bacterium AH-259-O06]|nr:hypothetical protein [Acidobacteria bacterium AH-259-O06]